MLKSNAVPNFKGKLFTNYKLQVTSRRTLVGDIQFPSMSNAKIAKWEGKFELNLDDRGILRYDGSFKNAYLTEETPGDLGHPNIMSSYSCETLSRKSTA